jgi:hypothetical protein
MSESEHRFPWADQPLAIRTLLTGLTLPIAAPVLMLLSLAVAVMGLIVVLAIPFAYVIAGLRSGQGDGQ